MNLIGEHTDYNAGLVLPVALPHATYAAVRARADELVRITSGQQDETWEGTLGRPRPGRADGLGRVCRGRHLGAPAGRPRRARRRPARGQPRAGRRRAVLVRGARVLGRGRGRRPPGPRAHRRPAAAADRGVHPGRDRGRGRADRRHGPDGRRPGPGRRRAAHRLRLARDQAGPTRPGRTTRCWSPTPGSRTSSPTAGTAPAAPTARAPLGRSACRRCARPTRAAVRPSPTTGSAAGRPTSSPRSSGSPTPWRPSTAGLGHRRRAVRRLAPLDARRLRDLLPRARRSGLGRGRRPARWRPG